MGSMPAKWDAAYAAYKGKINTFARNSYYRIPGYTVKDMEQELAEVLWWCVFDYHPRNGASFNTFFQTSAKNKIASLIRHHSALKRTAELVSLETEELQATIDDIFTTMSPEDVIVSRLTVQEYVVEMGPKAFGKFIKRNGVGSLMKEDDEKAS